MRAHSKARPAKDGYVMDDELPLGRASAPAGTLPGAVSKSPRLRFSEAGAAISAFPHSIQAAFQVGR